MYYGKQPQFEQYLTDTFTSSVVTYAAGYPLTYNPGIAQAVEVILGGGTQRPNVDYVVANQILVFTPAIPDGISVYIRYLGIAGTPTTVQDNSIVPNKISETLLSKVLSGGTITLTTNEATAFSVYEFTGALGSNAIVQFPANVKRFQVDNKTTGAFTLTVKTVAGAGVSIPQGTQGSTSSLYCNGTDIEDSNNGKAGTGANSDITSISGIRVIQPITATVATNALTVGLNPTSFDIRSATLTTGVPNFRIVPSAISLVVPSTATLGTVSATQARLVLLAIDNVGTVELAVTNLAGGLNLDETTLISTTAISAAATAANVIYSTTSRTNVPFRVVGFIDITEVTAGTWATAPTTVQGTGGQSGSSLGGFGVGQTWQMLAGSRVIGSTYYNTTGKSIWVQARVTSSANYSATLAVNGTALIGSSTAAGSGSFIMGFVPPGGNYVITVPATATLYEWDEFR